MSLEHLSACDRGEIKALLEQGKSKTYIANTLGRSLSTISREVKRNSINNLYNAEIAQKRYRQRRVNCRPSRKLEYRPLWAYLIEKLSLYWSPEQIANRLPIDYPDDPQMRISHETLYKAIYSDERLSSFVACLRQARPKRRKKGQGRVRRCIIPHRTSIHERPKQVQERSRFGDWEGDLILGSNQQGAVLSLVARNPLMLLTRKLQSKKSDEVIAAVIDAMENLPASWAKTITFDNGTEFYHHQRITEQLGIATYFADPYAAYQRGANENINGLLRQYLPKGSSFENLTQTQLDVITDEINSRPRKTLGYQTPYEVLQKYIHERNVALRN